MIPSVPARICYAYIKLAGSFKVSMPHENGSKIQGNSIQLSPVWLPFYNSGWINLSYCLLELITTSNRDGRISTDLLKTNNVQTVYFWSSQLPFLILFNRLYTLSILPPLFSKIRQIHEICVSLILVFNSYVALLSFQSQKWLHNPLTNLLTHTLKTSKQFWLVVTMFLLQSVEYCLVSKL